MKSIITLLLLLSFGTAYGKSSKQELTQIASDTLTVGDRYERMLLDSLIVLEALKPVHHKLQVAYEARGEEIKRTWALVRMHEVQDQLSSKRIEKLDTELRGSKRKYWLKGFGWGAAVAALTLIITR